MSPESGSSGKASSSFAKRTFYFILTVLAGIFVLLAVMEFVVFPRVLTSLPLKFRGALPYALKPLAEVSKNGAVPEDYIAIFGDSYAFGEGDWIIDSNKWTNPRHGVADLLHERTGQNFISFGQSAKGSLIYLASAPKNFYDFYKKTLAYRLEKPKAIAVFFYEGNDLNNNLEDILLRFQPKYDLQRMMDPAYFRKFIEQEIIPIHAANSEVKNFSLGDQFVFLHYLFRVLTGDYDKNIHMAPLSKPWKAVTFVQSGGHNVTLPNELEGPGMEIADQNVILPLYVFEQSLAYFRTLFPDTKIAVFYVPSPLTSYELTSELAATRSYTGRGEADFKTEDIRRRSDFVAGLVEKIAVTQGHAFVDARPALRKASSQGYVHGPKDWDHLNQRGYEALADVLQESFERLGFFQNK